MKNKILSQLVWICAAFSLFLMSPISGTAQNVTVDVSIDSLQRLIGEQARIKLEVSCGAKQKIELPQFADTLVTGVEIIDITKADTQYLNNKERMLITQEYTITSFDSAAYYIPPFKVMVDSQAYYSQNLNLMVYSMEVDEENPEMFFGPKEIMDIKLSWEDWKPVCWYLLALICVVAATIYLIKRSRDNAPIMRILKTAPKIPPHEVAMKEIERIKADKNWQKGNLKEYYTELTDVIRVYIHNRFGFNAMEKTSAEIIEYLQQEENKESVGELKQLFETADLVKFAKFAPLLNENDMNLVAAIDFVNQTKSEEEVNVEPVQELTVDEKRSSRVKKILNVGIAVLVVLVILIISFLIEHIYGLFF